jgi:AraC-like DNA-binding protein
MLYLDVSIIQDLHLDTTGRAAGDFAFPAPVMPGRQIRTIFETAFAAASSEDSQQAMSLEQSLLHLIARLEGRKRPRPHPDRVIVQRAQTRIDDDPAAPLTLRELAAEAGISRYQLHRAFISHLGLPPHQYILQSRLALARRLIRAGTALADVAAAAGFSDQSHLNRRFSRQFGISPGKY